VKNFLSIIFVSISSIYSINSFADGFIDEILFLNEETKGCVSNTHTSFRNLDQLSNCTNVDVRQFSKLNSIDNDLTQLSRYAYLSEQIGSYSKKLSQKYKDIYPLHQNLSFNGPSGVAIENEKKKYFRKFRTITYDRTTHER